MNPAFVVKNWGKDPVKLEIDDERIMPGRDFRIGYEDTESGTSLIVWLKLESSEPVNVTLRKGRD